MNWHIPGRSVRSTPDEYRHRPVLLVVGILLLCIIRSSFGSDLEVLLPDTETIAFSAYAQPLEPLDLAEIALAFSGVDAADRDGYLSRVEAIVSSIVETVSAADGPYQAGEQILRLLHEEYLLRYSEPQTRLDVLLDTGTYNCVSSSVLYFIVSRAAGLDIGGIVTPDHAFCSIDIGERVVDVETTTAYGYDPGRKQDFFDEFGNLTGYSYVPPSNYRSRSSIDDRGVVALILHNRISMRNSQGDFAGALELAVERHAFLGNETSLNDLNREISNYVASLNQRREYRHGISVIVAAQERYGPLSSLQVLHRGVLHNLVIELANAGEYAEVREMLDATALGGYLAEDVVGELRSMAAQRELAAVLPDLPVSEGFELLETRKPDLADDPGTIREFSVSLYARLANQTAIETGYLAAAAVVDRAILEIGRDPRLEQARSVYRYNHAAEAHNRFAEYFNAGKLEEARSIVIEALEAVPESPLLAGDLRTVNRVLEAASTR